MNFLDEKRDEFMSAALESSGVKSEETIGDNTEDVESNLIAMLEDELGICVRDSIRIARAWMGQKKAPERWQYK